MAAAVLACGADRALAQALEPDTPPSDGLSGGTKVERVLLYAGFDIWRFGRTGYGGFYWAPDGLNNDGFITRLFVSRGVERYDAGSEAFQHQHRSRRSARGLAVQPGHSSSSRSLPVPNWKTGF